MARVVYVIPSSPASDEVARLLADIEVEVVQFGAVVPEGGDLEDAARHGARAAFALLGRPCFVERTAVELDGCRGDVTAELAARGEAGFCAVHGGKPASARVVVALAEDAGELHVFSGHVEGTIASAPAGRGWDGVFIPEGHRRTLAAIGNHRYLVNMRYVPFLDLADHLRGASAGGAYEAHVTVRTTPAEASRFAARCDALDLKCVLIELPAGAMMLQPMTATVHRGVLRTVQDEVHELARALVADGFDVVRTKIEALPKNRDWPETEAEACARPAGYFEYHLKLALPAGEAAAIAAVAAACEPHGARLSRNANGRGAEGEEHRFVTLRVPRLGRAVSEARLAALADAIRAAGYAIRATISEYTVYDSDIGIDRGWL